MYTLTNNVPNQQPAAAATEPAAIPAAPRISPGYQALMDANKIIRDEVAKRNAADAARKAAKALVEPTE